MRNILTLFILFGGLLFAGKPAFAQAGAYKIVKTFHIASAGGWDYIATGPDNKLYVSHGTQVNILNKNTGDSVGVIANTQGVHGIAFDVAHNKGYSSNGRTDNVTEFDAGTGAVTGQIGTGKNPDAILYEPFTKTIITCNGRSADLTVIDPLTRAIKATIAVGGKPETAVSNGEGMLFVNLEDKNEIVVVDLRLQKVVAHWSIAPADGPTGLAIDLDTHRLFAGCDKQLVVVDYLSGKKIATVAIGDGCDGVAFDPSRKNIFASCGEGNLYVIHEAAADHYKVIQTLPTKRSARTLTYDPASNAAYLPAADLQTAAGETRPRPIAGTFQVLVVAIK